MNVGSAASAAQSKKRKKETKKSQQGSDVRGSTDGRAAFGIWLRRTLNCNGNQSIGINESISTVSQQYKTSVQRIETISLFAAHIKPQEPGLSQEVEVGRDVLRARTRDRRGPAWPGSYSCAFLSAQVFWLAIRKAFPGNYNLLPPNSCKCCMPPKQFPDCNSTPRQSM